MTTFTGPPLEQEGDAGPLTLGAFLHDAAARFGSREALVFHGPEGRVSWSYDDLDRQARRIGRALLAGGLAAGSRVAVLMGNRPEWVASTFGAAMAGGVVVPLNTFLERPELAWVLEHCDASVVLAQDRLLRHDYRSDLLAIDAPGRARVVCLGDAMERVEHWSSFIRSGDRIPDDALDERTAAVTPDDDAIIIYTSGTTAKPKGVLHAQRTPCLQSRRLARHLRLDADSRSWGAFPMFWTAGFAMVMGATFAAGGCLILQEHFEPGEALALLEAERVTTPHAWPHQLAALEEHPDWARTDLSALRHIETFGSFGRHPSVRVAADSWSSRAAYGLTETFTIITSLPADSPPDRRDHTQGRLLPGNALRILHPDTGEPQPAGADGEIAVAGVSMMKGYVKTSRELAFDPDGFFHTGDAGFVDDEGLLHWTGRTSEMIKTGGANISPVEIETELLRHPGLKTASAVGVPHPTLGELVVVCAVAHEGSNLDEEAVRRFLRGRIASYKIPKRVLFFRDDELSLTGNSKIRADALRALAIARLDDAARNGL